MRPFFFDRQQMAGGIRLRGGEVLTPKVGNIACAAGRCLPPKWGTSPARRAHKRKKPMVSPLL